MSYDNREAFIPASAMDLPREFWPTHPDVVAELAALRSEVERLTRERDEARFERNQERHARNLNELGLLAKLNESIDERDSLSSQLAEARATGEAMEKVVDAARQFVAFGADRARGEWNVVRYVDSIDALVAAVHDLTPPTDTTGHGS